MRRESLAYCEGRLQQDCVSVWGGGEIRRKKGLIVKFNEEEQYLSRENFREPLQLSGKQINTQLGEKKSRRKSDEEKVNVMCLVSIMGVAYHNQQIS